jgi:hypothetical protein
MKLFDAAPFKAVAIVEPASTNWLHLPSLHAELLPLAIAAGHDALQLGCLYGSDAPSGCTYEATGIGGEAGNRFYVTWLEAGDSDTAPRFAQVLREKLLAAAEQNRLTMKVAA